MKEYRWVYFTGGWPDHPPKKEYGFGTLEEAEHCKVPGGGIEVREVSAWTDNLIG